jgi:hypothetical protein
MMVGLGHGVKVVSDVGIFGSVIVSLIPLGLPLRRHNVYDRDDPHLARDKSNTAR